MEDLINNAINQFKDLSKKPENFLQVQNQLEDNLTTLVKQFYDNSKHIESVKINNTLEVLTTENFDNEQIWQQIELHNNQRFPLFVNQLSKFLTHKNNLKYPLKETDDEDKDQEEADDEEIIEGEEDDDEELSGSDEEDEMDSEKDEDDYSDDDKLFKKKEIQSKPKGKPSIVDDRFFKLRDMEEFLEKEENKKSSGENEIDYFASDISSDDDEAEDVEGLEESNGMHYKDFFDPVDNEKGQQDEVDEKSESDEDEEEDDEAEGTKQKSTFESRQERLNECISKIHDEALEEKPWQLLGEITAASRPENSLLQEVLEFDFSSRPAPVITEQTTIKLEDIIKQRIKDKAWDDVERKIKPVETIMEYKKQIILDQEKSKISLSAIYEQEYLKKKSESTSTVMDVKIGQEDKDTPEKAEIKLMLHSLFSKLDALSNYHYTPQTRAPEIKVISNLPAITIEEVSNVATSDATLLAPKEIKNKPRGCLISKEERSKTDMKRERRKKKKKQHVKRIHKEEKDSKKSKLQNGNKLKLKDATKHITKALKEKKIQKLEDSGKKAIKSSTAFFETLQNELSGSQKDGKISHKRKKASEKNLNVKKLKM